MLVEFLSGLESVILQRRNAHPNETFLKWKDQEIAWGDFVDHIYAMAAGFWDAGIRTGERVALMMGNCPEFLYTYYAMVFMGVGAVPLNIAQRGDALAYILNDSEASAIVIDEGLLAYFNNIRERVPNVRLVIVRGSIPSTMSNAITVEEWLKPGQTTTPEQLLNFCRGKMAHYAIPRYFELRDSLPKTGTHRIEYSVLKEEAFTDGTWDREAVGYIVSKDQ